MHMMWQVSEASKKLQFGKETRQNEQNPILLELFSSAILLEAKQSNSTEPYFMGSNLTSPTNWPWNPRKITYLQL